MPPAVKNPQQKNAATEARSVKIFYIGNKPVKIDNVLNRKNLSWFGYGSSNLVPIDDAVIYLRFPMVWADEEGFARFDADRQAADQQEQIVEVTTGDDDDKKPNPLQNQSQENTGDPNDRDLFIQGAILQLDPTKVSTPAKDDQPAVQGDYTEQGTPSVARVVEILGTNVGAEEIDAAYRTLKAAGKVK